MRNHSEYNHNHSDNSGVSRIYVRTRPTDVTVTGMTQPPRPSSEWQHGYSTVGCEQTMVEEDMFGMLRDYIGKGYTRPSCM